MQRKAWAREEPVRNGDDYEPDMPPLDAGGYLIGYLWEIGPIIPAGMGNAEITQGEIRHFQDNMGIELQPWEVRFLRRLSSEYLDQSHKSADPMCPPPYGALARRDDVAKKIDAIFG